MGLFSFHDKKKSKNCIKLHTDLHSHILPGIDDGASDLDESLEMAQSFINAGLHKIITTPHVHPGVYDNTSQDISNAAHNFQDALKAENIPLKLEYAAEYFVCPEVLTLMQSGEILSFGWNYVLVEFDFFTSPFAPEKFAQDSIKTGYTPVLAHPERYEYWTGNRHAFQQLKNAGYLFQANIPSAANSYGIEAKRNFHYLSSGSMIDFLGSDAHDAATIQSLDDIINSSEVQNVLLKGIKNEFL